jgi:sarcosine oxidase subunit beta
MTQTADAIVVGGGLEGLSTAYHLATAGYGRVTVFERALLCSGGTAKSSGVVRAHYGVPSLAAMAWYGNQFLSSAKEILSAEVGFEQTGYVVGVGPGNVEALRANVDMQRSLGVDVELVPLDKVAELWPWADLDDFEAFAYEPQGGYGDAYLTGQAFAAAARNK